MTLRKPVNRRSFLRKTGAAGAGVAGLALTGVGITAATVSSEGSRPTTASAGVVALSGSEDYPTSPLIMRPFYDPLFVPKAAAPVPDWMVGNWNKPPDSGYGQQSSVPGCTHQIWPGQKPLVYQVKLQVAPVSFSSSQVLPIDSLGQPVTSWDASRRQYAAGTQRSLPASTAYGFNGMFPGPMINAEYGKPALLRFQNELDQNPYNLDRQDFGAPDHSFLCHLHNGHTAPESDGNPNDTMTRLGMHGYPPGAWVDNLYLNTPAGGDEREKQSFFWFHDHRMDHTGANVYKGLFGLYPIYDPIMDNGDETTGFRLPGVRTNNSDGSFDVAYDIPLAFYDMRLDDGRTKHRDFHNGTGEKHQEWWGKTFFRHYPNKGFVGDVFTVNGKAFPVLEVKRRKYRFRFLDASVARIYDFKLMSSSGGPKSAVSLGYTLDELQGQYRIQDGQQCMKFTEIAVDGGLMPAPIGRDNFQLFPAKRREVVIDFTKYMDGSPTKKGDVIYLTNVSKMTTGRMPDLTDPNYKVPLLKIIIAEDGLAADASVIPAVMRPLPALPGNLADLVKNRRQFELARIDLGGENQWAINGQAFDPAVQMASVKRNTWEAWEIRNGGGGWVHPLHLHMEEHQTITRNGVASPDAKHPDDKSREDVVALEPGESVVIARQFRTFTGQYVGHCHNLAHEDHAMMFGWEIVS